MKYSEMKEIDLLSIKTKSDAEEIVENVIESELNDILKYINHLRYLQYNSTDFKLREKISKFLFFDGIAEIERENSDCEFGENEELAIKKVEKKKIINLNIFSVDGIEYSCKSQLSDDFETILIATNTETDEYIKFGTIDKAKSKGKKFAYVLEKEADEFYDRIIESDKGTKVNILSVVINQNHVTKTYTKESIDTGFEFTTAKKTDKGIFSNVMSGSFVLLKEEDLLIPAPIIKEETKTNTMSIGNGISIEGVGPGTDIGMMSGDDFKKLMDDAGGPEGLEDEIKRKIINSNLDKSELFNNLDDNDQKMISDLMSMSDEEFDERYTNDNEPLTIEELEEDLEDAIRSEEYELASELKEKISKLKKS